MITDTDNGTNKLGVLLAMRPGLSNLVKSQKIAFGLALLGIVVLFGAKRLIEWALDEPVAESWVDLSLVLAAYLYFFMIPALQAHISKKLRRRAARRQKRQAADQPTPAANTTAATTSWVEKQPQGLTQPVAVTQRPVRQGRTQRR
ncbi:hypothetical protein [Pseudomonas sp. FEN]|uniref:hypothetical protein n=1 Tax=Pseudomonas sp. FEN TaxID=2767468 RepID=UPI00174C875B|nr:hypothetical protein [Pseudomonas sp. FEN]CAD5201604.1 hypothetical protein [Pseudomonas sp. FEN]